MKLQLPDFSSEYANAKDPGTQFHKFVGEVFARDHPDLESYLAPGKDGAIDVFSAGSQGVWECKFVGENGKEAIRPRWQEVRRHLEANLLDDKPKAAQYQPWYKLTRPTARYRFCVSARFANLAQKEELEQEIAQDFARLSQRRGLAHLAHIQVEVWSWDRFEPLLTRYPDLRYRWFGTGLPSGVQTFQKVQERQHAGFQAYLHGHEKIRYVSLLDPHTPAAVLESMVGAVGHMTTVLHGRGGAGKSRLLIEVGRLAAAQRWTVFVLQAQAVTPDTLTTALREVGSARVLLLMDYIERCTRWEECLAALRDAADAGAQVRMLGTCRSSWASRLDPYQAHLLELPLALPETVAGILAQRPALSDYVQQCQNIPVFAAFLCLLHDSGKQTALDELRQQQDFGRWLQEHIARVPGVSGFSQAQREHALVKLLMHLPCSSVVIGRLEQSDACLREYRHQLQQDGWLDFDIGADPAEQWHAVHDVLADGALLRWVELHRVGHEAEAQLSLWLQEALQLDNVSTVLRSLQRVARESQVRALPWSAILKADANSPWLTWRDAILRTHLMPAGSALKWLLDSGESTAVAVLSHAVLATIGDCVVALHKPTSGDPECLGIEPIELLMPWLRAAIDGFCGQGAWLHPQTPNKVLVQILRWQPQEYAGAAAQWLENHAGQEQAQFMLNAWLALPAEHCSRERVLTWVRYWLSKNGRRPVASFVFSSYLKANLPCQHLEQAISIWLSAHERALGANFVLNAWLDAGGDKSVVQQPMLAWLSAHERALGANFVLNAWLDAGGDKSVVQQPMLAWLSAHARALDASHVFKTWLDAGGDKSVVQQPMLAWLSAHERALDANFVLNAWLDAGGDKSVVQQPMLAWLSAHERALRASHVFKAWLDAGGDMEVVQEGCKTWFLVEANALSSDAGFVLRATGDRLKRLPDWLVQSAFAWVRTWKHSDEAGYPLKIVAGHPLLDADTTAAVVDWCVKFADQGETDVIGRLARLGQRQFASVQDRAGLINKVLHIIDAGGMPTSQAASNSFVLLGMMHCIACLFALPSRGSEESRAAAEIAPKACRVLRQFATIEVPDFGQSSVNWLEPIISADWERMVQLGTAAGIISDPAFRSGVRNWAHACQRYFVASQREWQALQRLVLYAQT